MILRGISVTKITMAKHLTTLEDSVLQQIESRILEAIPGASVTALGGGGHFSIRVISDVFAGKPTIQKHRLVLRAVAPLMDGAGAPVHAIDSLVCEVPS